MEAKLKQYAIWSNDNCECDGDCPMDYCPHGYWLLYDTKEEAVEAVDSNCSNGVIFRLDAHKLGRYKKTTTLVKVKERKTAKRKKK